MSLACMIEINEHPKIEVRWPVKMQTSVGYIDGEIERISDTCAYIRCTKPLSRSDFFSMTIEPPNRPPMEVGAEVIWIEIYLTPEREATPVGMEVRLINMSPNDLQLLSNLVSDNTKS